MGLISEFKTFAVKGNAVDLAVGVIIGAAFGRIVTSIVEDLIMPPIGKIVGNLDFSNLYVSLSEKIDAVNHSRAATQPTGGGISSLTGFLDTASRLPLAEARKIGPVLAYGNFLTILLNFMIVAFCIFLLVKGINRMKRAEAAAPSTPPVPTKEELLLTDIRDILARK
jgi:large conductance mechanosensitive channel